VWEREREKGERHVLSLSRRGCGRLINTSETSKKKEDRQDAGGMDGRGKKTLVSYRQSNRFTREKVKNRMTRPSRGDLERKDAIERVGSKRCE